MPLVSDHSSLPWLGSKGQIILRSIPIITFKEQLQAAQRQLTKLQDALSLMLLFEDGKRYDLAYDKAFEFAYESEKLTLLAREIPAYTGHPGAKERIGAQVTSSSLIFRCIRGQSLRDGINGLSKKY